MIYGQWYLEHIEKSSSQTALNRYRRIVPQKYHKKSKLAKHRPLIFEAGGPVQLCLKIDRKEKLYAACKLVLARQPKMILVPQESEHLYNAIILYGKMLLGPRTQRYMSLFKVYELISTDRKLEFRAIRHSISHSSRELTHQKTADFLIREFGSKCIELGSYTPNYKHLSKFYCYFGQLIIETEKEIRNAVKAITPRSKQYAKRYYLL